jgi:hypothetical protein
VSALLPYDLCIYRRRKPKAHFYERAKRDRRLTFSFAEPIGA